MLGYFYLAGANLLLCCMALVLERSVFNKLRPMELEFAIYTSLEFLVSRSLAIYAGNSLDEGPQTMSWLKWGFVCGWCHAISAMGQARLKYSLASGAGKVSLRTFAVLFLSFSLCVAGFFFTILPGLRSDSSNDGQSDSGLSGGSSEVPRATHVHSETWYFLWAYDPILLTIRTLESLAVYALHKIENGPLWLLYVEIMVGSVVCLLSIYLCTHVLLATGFALSIMELIVFIRGRNNVYKLKANAAKFYQYLSSSANLRRVTRTIRMAQNTHEMHDSPILSDSDSNSHESSHDAAQEKDQHPHKRRHFRCESQRQGHIEAPKPRAPVAGPADRRIDPQCAICHDEFTTVAHQLACKHTFHEMCLRQWLNKSYSCPICRRKPRQIQRRRSSSGFGYPFRQNAPSPSSTRGNSVSSGVPPVIVPDGDFVDADVSVFDDEADAHVGSDGLPYSPVFEAVVDVVGSVLRVFTRPRADEGESSEERIPPDA